MARRRILVRADLRVKTSLTFASATQGRGEDPLAPL